LLKQDIEFDGDGADGADVASYLIFFDKSDESGSFDLHGLAGTVVNGDDKVKEVGFAQVTRRLLLEVSSAHTQPAPNRETNKIIIKKQTTQIIVSWPHVSADRWRRRRHIK